MVYRAFYNFTGAFKGQEIDYPIGFTNVNDPSVKECRILNLNAKTFNKKIRKLGNNTTQFISCTLFDTLFDLTLKVRRIHS